jgi:hypothetical protein
VGAPESKSWVLLPLAMALVSDAWNTLPGIVEGFGETAPPFSIGKHTVQGLHATAI